MAVAGHPTVILSTPKKIMLWMSWEAITMKAGFEPTAEARVMAKQLFNLYMALTLEGFSEEQALSIISTTIYSMYQKGD